MAGKDRDPANVAAAAQEAEERKLLRKKTLRKDEKAGVSFSDELSDSKESSSEESEDSDRDLESSEANVEDLIQSEESKESVESESPKTPKGKGKLEIISDGTYDGTLVILNNKKLQNPDVLIRISSKEVSFQIFQIVRSKVPLV